MARKKNRYRSKRSRRSGTLRTWLKTALALLTLVVSVVLLSGALAYSYHQLLEAPWLRVEEIRITGSKHMDNREILNTLGVPRNANVLTLKMAKLAERLQSLPWVRSAVVRLDLPARIVVEITEREPTAVIAAEDTFLMDKEGKLFMQTTPEQSPDLVVMTGFSGLGLRKGSVLPAGPFNEVKRLTETIDKARNWLPLKQIAGCNWQTDEGFVLYTAHNNTPVRLGTEDLDAKLDRLRRVFGMLEERHLLDMVTRIDLDYSNRAFVEGNFPRPKAPHAS